MKIIKNLMVGLAFLVVALAAIGFLLPSEFKVQRSIVIDAPPHKIYPHIANLKQWRLWGVWFQRDPDMEVKYDGRTAEVGMKSIWKSEQEGSGEMTILALKPSTQMRYSLYFPDFDMGSTGEFELKETAGKTLVTWSDYGDMGNNPVNRYFGLFMDGMIGPEFETGLKNLQGLVEGI